MLRCVRRKVAPLLVGFLFGTLLFSVYELLAIASTSDWSFIDKPYPLIYTKKSISVLNRNFSTTYTTSLQQYRILIVVLSSASNLEQRDTVRRTWLELYQQDYSPEVTITFRFAIGMKNARSRVRNKVASEQRLYHDLLLLDIEESYDGLSLKVRQIFSVVHNAVYDYLVKVDDDSYLQVHLLIKALKKMGYPESLYWGYMSGNQVPLVEGKWKESGWFLCPHYASFGLGAGYIVSWKFVRQIGQFADRLKVYHNEDVTVGSWLIPYQIQRVHDVRFAASHHGHCSSRYIVSHKESMQSLLVKKRRMLKKGKVCSNKDDKISRIGHEYNWAVPPDQCCVGRASVPIPLT